MANLCLSLLSPPSIEEKLLDLLLDAVSDDIFTSTATASHGLSQGRLNPAEQVMGRSAATHLQIILSEVELEPLLVRLREEFRGTGLRYWASPVVLEGEIE